MERLLVAVIIVVALLALYFAHKVNTFSNSCTLKTNLRRLWSEHGVYTRLAIMAHISNDPQLDFVSRRLLVNQEDIGAAISAKLGKENGDRLALLLKEHIALLVATLNVAKNEGNGVGYSFDKDAVKNAVVLLRKNGDDVCDHLNRINKRWSLDDLRKHMTAHLDKTLREADLRAKRDHSEDIRNFDEILVDLYAFSDYLHKGMV